MTVKTQVMVVSQAAHRVNFVPIATDMSNCFNS